MNTLLLKFATLLGTLFFIVSCAAAPTSSVAPTVSQPTAVPPTRPSILPTANKQTTALPTLAIPAPTRPTLRPTATPLPPTPAPTPLPTAILPPLPSTSADLAWLWLPKVLSDENPLTALWRLGIPESIPSGDLVAITGSGQARLLGRDATDVLHRPNTSPLAILPVSPTNRLALFDPANGSVITDRNVESKSFLAPDETQLAARIPLVSSPDQIFNAIQISDVTTGLTSTTDIYDNYSLRYTNVLLGWGPAHIYGARHDR